MICTVAFIAHQSRQRMHTFMIWLLGNVSNLLAIVVFIAAGFHVIRLLAISRREDAVLDRLNLRLSSKQSLFLHDLTLPIRSKKTTQIDGLVITPAAIFIIELKQLQDLVKICGRSLHWLRRKGNKWALMASPFLQQNAHAGAVMKALGSH